MVGSLLVPALLALVARLSCLCQFGLVLGPWGVGPSGCRASGVWGSFLHLPSC